MTDTPAPEFRLIDSGADGPLIGFEAVDTGQAVLANRAVHEVMSEHGLDPVHRLGAEATHEDGPHLHGWAAAQPVGAARLRELLADVAERYGSDSFG